MKLPKLELKLRRWKPQARKEYIFKQYAKGKSRYMLQFGLMYASMYVGMRILLDLFTGKLFTVIPGYPVHIVFQGHAIISILIWTLFSPLAGYFFASRQWKRTETTYQKYIAEEQGSPLIEDKPSPEELDPVSLRKVPVFLRNLR